MFGSVYRLNKIKKGVFMSMGHSVENKHERIFYFIFTLSGFSGLIYESIWTHYLKLFLGHAAYAQTLVLAIFMGGMAIGSWICSKYSLHWKNLLIGYALVEGLVGLFALLFHTAFDHAVQLSYSSIIPLLTDAAVASIYKWSLSTLLILPQSVLLGMTFPLMSAGILRMSPQRSGRTISLLYFANSIGAAAGVLMSGFILIRLVGLPGTIRIAGLINIALALSVWLLVRGRSMATAEFEIGHDNIMVEQTRGWTFLFLAASFITGTASFMYEVGWIRMLSLVLGSSTNAFELMLSAFIFGLAFGGLWIQRRIDRIAFPGKFLAYVQIAMGLLALSTLVLYGQTFALMQWLVDTLHKTEAGYALFNLSSHAIALAIMLPTTFCAGTTLPLITYALIKRGVGERSIGAVYAANTVGAILGVFLAVHVAMPLFGLKGLITCGAGLDMALGLLLLWVSFRATTKRLYLVAVGFCFCAVTATLSWVNLDLYKMASGVYRDGRLLTPGNSELLYYKDGKTATVSVSREGGSHMEISTNGKVDAAINMRPQDVETADEDTMILLGVIPMTLHPQARTVAAIGFGSGLTTNTLLSNPLLTQVDTIEIEKSIVEAANHFRPRVELAYTDPRSAIFYDDAKTFFSIHKKRYDIIVSEPSNPWVSGVAGLFSEEFYHLISQHLEKNGIFVQWLQLYEINMDLVSSVLKALSTSYSDFVVYAANDSDIIIVAKNGGTIGDPDPGVLKIPELSTALERVRVNSLQDIEVRKIGDKKILDKLLQSFPIRANSDYYPVLDQNAARARFLKSNAYELQMLSHFAVPVFELLHGDHPSRDVTDVTQSVNFEKSRSANEAMALAHYFLQGSFNARYGDIPQDIKQQALLLRRMFYDCHHAEGQDDRISSLYYTSVRMTTFLSPRELDAIWKKLESGPCAHSLSAGERGLVSLFEATGRRDAKVMASAAQHLLERRQLLQPGIANYCVAVGMLGYLMQGDGGEALKLWRFYQPSEVAADKPNILFQLLVASGSPSK
jgi:spermidine synthase